MSGDPTSETSSGSGTLTVLAQFVAGLVSFATRRAKAVIAVALVLAAVSGFYAAANFDIRTDMDSLVSKDLGWRKISDRIETLFPSEGEDFVIVVDAATPEFAEQATAKLTEELSQRQDLFLNVQRINGGEFFSRHGLLFSSEKDVQDTTEALIAAQPFLGPLASDPSLRGVAKSAGFAVSNASQDSTDTGRIVSAITRISDAIHAGVAGEAKPFSWSLLLSGENPPPRDWRQFILLNPKLDFSEVLPGQPGSNAIHAAVKSLGVGGPGDVKVRITGSVPIGDEELGTLAESTGPIAVLMFAIMVAILYRAVKSTRMVISMLVTVVIGALITTAIGLLLLGRFNLISIAFLPLFIGLGMDFAVQYSVRARAERLAAPSLPEAQRLTALAMGGGLALAAMATAAGFLAFLPTSYRGVAELGLIAGFGMVVSFLLTVTLLPALICVFDVQKAAPEEGLKLLKNADSNLGRVRNQVLLGALVLGVGSLLALPLLKFNFDPMVLRSPKTEAMATYLELAEHADSTPNTVAVLTDNIEHSRALAARLSKLPDVGQVIGLHSLIPPDQDAKLALIADANMLLSFSLQPFDVAPPPSDAETVNALREAGAQLTQTLTGRSDALARAGLALAKNFSSLADAPPAVRAKVSTAMTAGLQTTLDQINMLLSAEPVSLETIPDQLRRGWLAKDGHLRLEVSPARPLDDVKKTSEFVAAVRAVAPDAAGDAVSIIESGKTILGAFGMAGLLSGGIILLMLFIVFRSLSWVILTIAPVVLSGLLTFASCGLLGMVINLENMIALPLLLGIGVAFNIYFVVAWRNGATDLLASSLSRGVWFSALTTGASFGALALSAHPGTASMGALLGLSLGWIVLTTLIVSPALLQAFEPNPKLKLT